MCARQASIPAAAAGGLFGIAGGGHVCAYPVTAGTATAYLSTSPQGDCEADIAAGNFTSGIARWSAIESLTAVTALTRYLLPAPVVCVALKATTGDWRLEVAN